MKTVKPVTDKLTIAAALQEIGTLLELKGGEYFKARAYKLGARSIAELTEDIGKLIKQNRLTFVKGIGYALAKQIQDLYATGQSTFLNQLRAEMPPGIVELSHVPGLSVKKVERLHEELGISTIEELKAACESGRIREVKGFGAKTEQRLLEPSPRPRIANSEFIFTMLCAPGREYLSICGSRRDSFRANWPAQCGAGKRQPRK